MKGKVLTFMLGKTLCGIDIKYVKEICRQVEYTALIGEDEFLVGLMNLRGQVITLVNLAGLVQLVQGEHNRKYCVILKENQQHPDSIGFFADSLGEVLEVTDEMCEASPHGQGEEKNGFAQYVVKLKDEFILVFDVYKLVLAAGNTAK